MADGINQPGNYHGQDDEQIIIRHLYVVGINLESRKDGCEHKAPQVFATIGQHYTCNQWWQISQGPHLPDVTCGNDNEEIGAEGPYDRA